MMKRTVIIMIGLMAFLIAASSICIAKNPFKKSPPKVTAKETSSTENQLYEEDAFGNIMNTGMPFFLDSKGYLKDGRLQFELLVLLNGLEDFADLTVKNAWVFVTGDLGKHWVKLPLARAEKKDDRQLWIGEMDP